MNKISDFLGLVWALFCVSLMIFLYPLFLIIFFCSKGEFKKNLIEINLMYKDLFITIFFSIEYIFIFMFNIFKMFL